MMSAASSVAAARARNLTLDDGSKIAVIGSGPAGSLFAYFLLEMAGRVGTQLEVDIFESRKFAVPGPAGCNMCGGIISETLVQNLAIEGVNLPTGVIQRGIQSYVLHTDVGVARIATPLEEMRIGAVHRGAGPKDAKEQRWESFDHHLQAKALAAGAHLLQTRVEKIERGPDGMPIVSSKDGQVRTYDLIVSAVGVNSPTIKLFEDLAIGFLKPAVTKTAIREYYLGEKVINEKLGAAMHVFLLDIPRLEFAAIIPKGDYVTVAILGEDIDNELIEAFLTAPEVKACMPEGWNPEAKSCGCMPNINVKGPAKPYADRFVFVGDAGVTRLYKDGIGAAYRTSKAAARTALFEGISEQAWQKYFMPVCRYIGKDNKIGKVAFFVTRFAREFRFLRSAMLRMVIKEQTKPGPQRRMSGVLWDMFSGSAPYADIFFRMLKPGFLVRFVGSAIVSLWPRRVVRPALPPAGPELTP